MKPRFVRARGVTLVELLVVISIIAFLAGALVVASQKVRHQAQVHGTKALLEKLASANERFYNEWRFYAPDTPIPSLGGTRWVYETTPGIPATLETREVDVDAPGMPGDKMPTTPNEYLMISLQHRGQFMVVPSEYLAGPERKIDLRGLGVKKMQQVSSRCIIVDSWGHPIFYDCHKPEGKKYTNGLIYRNVNAFDMFSLGADGRTSSSNNELDDDGDGTIDESDESQKLGESADDMNNWRGQDRR